MSTNTAPTTTPEGFSNIERLEKRRQQIRLKLPIQLADAIIEAANHCSAGKSFQHHMYLLEMYQEAAEKGALGWIDFKALAEHQTA